MVLLPLRIEQNKYTFPTIKNEKGMVGSVLRMDDAEFIIKACNEYSILKEKVKDLEAELNRI